MKLPSNAKNIKGQRFGKLVAIRPTDERKHGAIIWEFKCDCGNTSYTNASRVSDGYTKSCGRCVVGKDECYCNKCEKVTPRYKDGHCRICSAKCRERHRQTPEYKKWRSDYHQSRQKTDPLYSLTMQIRKLLGASFTDKGYTKRSKAFIIIGCTYEELLSQIGEKPGKSYQIDHICPCTQAQNEEEFLKLWNHNNLQWLTREENIQKFNHKTPEGEAMCRLLLGREWIDG